MAIASLTSGCQKTVDHVVGAATPSITPPPASSTASSLAPLAPVFNDVHAADRLLSHPLDPNRIAEGVSLEKVIPRLAAPVIRDAIAKWPKTPRFHYLLGRLHEASRDNQQAVAAYRAAADLKYPMAYWRLGMAYGTADILPRDAVAADTFLRMAIDENVAIAKETLKQSIFDSEAFSSPDLFQAIYEKELVKGDIDDSDLQQYSTAFLEPFFNTPNSPDPIARSSWARLAQSSQVQALGQIFGEVARSRKNNPAKGAGNNFEAGMQEGQQITQMLVTQASKGRADAEVFYGRYGVQSPVAKQFFSNLEFYINRLGNVSFKDSLERSFTR